jgi:hypothetical protein
MSREVHGREHRIRTTHGRPLALPFLIWQMLRYPPHKYVTDPILQIYGCCARSCFQLQESTGKGVALVSLAQVRQDACLSCALFLMSGRKSDETSSRMAFKRSRVRFCAFGLSEMFILLASSPNHICLTALQLRTTLVQYFAFHSAVRWFKRNMLEMRCLCLSVFCDSARGEEM